MTKIFWKGTKEYRELHSFWKRNLVIQWEIINVFKTWNTVREQHVS